MKIRRRFGRRYTPLEPQLNSNGGYWQLSWYDENGQRHRKSMGPKSRLARSEAVKIVKEIKAELIAEFRAKTGRDKPPDGPRPPNIITIGGLDHPIAPLSWRLIAFMWDRKQATVADLTEHVWSSDEVSDNAINLAIHKINKQVRHAIKLPWVLRQKAGHVQKIRPRDGLY